MEQTKKSTNSAVKRLYRSETDRVIAGVAGGLGEYLEIDATFFRIAFLILMLAGGGGFLLYLLLWIVIPKKSDLKKDSKEYVKINTEELKHSAEAMIHQVDKSSGSGMNPVGMILIVVGGFFLLSNFGVLSWLDFGKLWPLLLIAVGVIALRKNT